MSEMKHTPLPWRGDDLTGFIWCASAKGGNRPVLEIRGWGYLTGGGHGALGLSGAAAREEQEAVCAYVVKAVNSHEALVAAATRVLAGLTARIEAAPGDAAPVFDGIAELHAALNLAGSQP